MVGDVWDLELKVENLYIVLMLILSGHTNENRNRQSVVQLNRNGSLWFCDLNCSLFIGLIIRCKQNYSLCMRGWCSLFSSIHCLLFCVQDDTYTESYISTIGVDFVSQIHRRFMVGNFCVKSYSVDESSNHYLSVEMKLFRRAQLLTRGISSQAILD